MLTEKLKNRLIQVNGAEATAKFLKTCTSADELFDQLNCEIGHEMLDLKENENLTTTFNGSVTIELLD